MELKNYADKFQKTKVVKRSDPKADDISDEISKTLKIKFPLVRKWANEIGSQGLNDIFREVMKAENVKSKTGLFISKVNKSKTEITWPSIANTPKKKNKGSRITPQPIS